MAHVLVVYGSRHGATRGIAQRIGAVLQAEGSEAVVASADDAAPDDVRTADAFVVGSAVYMGSWLNEPLDFLRRNQQELASRQTWLFSSGPLAGSSKEQPIRRPGGECARPGGGTRERRTEKGRRGERAIHPRGHRVFRGPSIPTTRPATLSERIVRMMPAANRILPPGDFREWDAIDAWAREIAATLLAPVPVA